MGDERRTGLPDRRFNEGQSHWKGPRPKGKPVGRRKDDVSIKIRRLRYERQGEREWFTNEVKKIIKMQEKVGKVKAKIKGKKGLLGLGVAIGTALAKAQEAYAKEK